MPNKEDSNDVKNFRLIDPTRNVRHTIKESEKRQDDLRGMAHKALRNEVKLEVKSLRSELKDFKSFIKKINGAESKRIDAIRAVDAANVVIANAAAETRASTLASQVTDTATAANVALKAETDPIRKSIDELRQSQWTIAGGSRQEAETKTDIMAKSSNVGLWVGIAAAVVFGVTSVGFNIVVIAISLYLGLRSP
jgi:hypothetical protein